MRFIESIPISTIGIFLVSVCFQFAALSCSCPAQDIENLSSGSSAIECPPADGDNIGITVEVTDKSGRPVTGLGESDFKVFDNKQTQKILDFRAVDANHPPAAPLRVEIIIDAVNSDALLGTQERDGLSAFLKQTSDMLAAPTTIWFLENTGLTPIAGPSQDRTALLTALNGALSRLRVINRSAGAWGADERNHQGTDLVEGMISSESKTPGRKLVLFLSPGWPMLFNFEPDKRSSVFDDIVRISNGLRESCISLDTLDPSSFGNNFQATGPGIGRATQYEDFLKGVAKSGDAVYPDLALQVLSEHSGGQVIIDGNDIKSEIDTALRGASAWYDLVFERAPGGHATEYHAIQVAVDKPHVKVRTTAGYYVSGP
jgi:VWFA-related protein